MTEPTLEEIRREWREEKPFAFSETQRERTLKCCADDLTPVAVKLWTLHDRWLSGCKELSINGAYVQRRYTEELAAILGERPKERPQTNVLASTGSTESD